MIHLKKINQIITIGCFVAMNFNLYAFNTQSTDRFEHAITKYQQKHWLNAQIVIAKNEKIIYRKNIGFADIERQVPFSNVTLFPIASISKQFTAVGILLLVEDGKISLHQPISVVINEKHPIWQGKMPEWANQITIHHLLTHTSGLKDYTDEAFDGVENVIDRDMVVFILSQVKDKPLLFSPGDSWAYSNTGYLLLYTIMEIFSSQSDVNQFLNNRIFKPLNMTHTFMPSISQERTYINFFNQSVGFPIRYVTDIDNLAIPPKKLQHLHFQAPTLGGASMVSTVDDLLKWNTALYHGEILSEQSLTLFTTIHFSGDVDNCSFGGPIKHGYGLFITKDNPSNTIYEHGGWIEGIRAHLSYATGNGVTVLILSNVSPDESLSKDQQYRQVHGLTVLANELQLIAFDEGNRL